MLSLRTALLASTVGLAACASGGGGNGGGGGSGGEEGNGGSESLTLYESIRQIPTTSLDTQSIVGNMKTFMHDNFDIEYSNQQEGYNFSRQRAQTDSSGLTLYNEGSGFALAMLPEAVEADGSLNYTTFGLWARSDGTGNFHNSFRAPVELAATFYDGLKTPTEAIPNAGVAIFYGRVVAIEINPATSESLDVMSGNMSVFADFRKRSLDGEATLLSKSNGQVWGSLLTGEMSMVDKSADFRGSEMTSTLGHSGKIEGSFFGPNGQEIGGAFALKRAATSEQTGSQLNGSFGAKR